MTHIREQNAGLKDVTNDMNIRSCNNNEMLDSLSNYLKVIENFILMVIHANERCKSILKLDFCYRCISAIRQQLGSNSYFKENVLMNFAKSVIICIQRCLRSMRPCTNNHKTVEILDYSKRSVQINQMIHNSKQTCRKRFRRRVRSHKKISKMLTDSMMIHHNYYDQLRELNVQQFVDNIYFRIRSILADTCYENFESLKDVTQSLDYDFNANERLPEAAMVLKNGYQHLSSDICNKVSSGDCKEVSTTLSFHKSYLANNSDLNGMTFVKHIITNSQFCRPYHEKEIENEYSENEIDADIADSCLFRPEKRSNVDFLPYCGDCDYNSSNSKNCLDEDEAPIGSIHDDNDGSDSDGGTEILNSVNDTVNKFNAIMQQRKPLEERSIGKCPSPMMWLNENGFLHSKTDWTNRYSPYSNFHQEPNYLESTTSKVCPTVNNLPFVLDSYPNSNYLSPYNTTKNNDENNLNPPASSNNLINIPAHNMTKSTTSLSLSPPTVTTVSNLTNNVNYNSLSKLIMSPGFGSNWYLYNCNQSPNASRNQNVQPIQPVKNGENSIISNENSYQPKLLTWVPNLSSPPLFHNSYNYASNHHQQQQYQRTLQSQQFSIPLINLGSLQPGVIHPHLYHHSSHSAMEHEFNERRQTNVNQMKTFYSIPSTSNNYVNESQYSYMAPVNLSVNSNCSNISSPSTNSNVCPSVIKSSLDKSQRACCFYMRGGCKKEDCEYAHDLSKVTCKFWEKGDCFKADTCPFKHGYVKD